MVGLITDNNDLFLPPVWRKFNWNKFNWLLNPIRELVLGKISNPPRKSFLFSIAHKILKIENEYQVKIKLH